MLTDLVKAVWPLSTTKMDVLVSSFAAVARQSNVYEQRELVKIQVHMILMVRMGV